MAGARWTRDAVVGMCRTHPALTGTDGSQVDVRGACSVLAAWNGRADGPAAHYATRPQHHDPDVQHALADAVEYFQALGVPLDIPLGAVQHYAGISLPGCPEGEGCFDRVEGQRRRHRRQQRLELHHGHRADAGGPRTRTILTYSESANPL
jgi:acyl-homoserine-lactone acylase